MNLSTKYTKKTFVGFGTLQNIFEQTQLELKSEDIQVSQVNNFGSDPIELSFVQNKPK